MLQENDDEDHFIADAGIIVQVRVTRLHKQHQVTFFLILFPHKDDLAAFECPPFQHLLSNPNFSLLCGKTTLKKKKNY